MHITSLYAAVLALFFIGLSFRTLRLRRSLKVTIGDSGNPIMLRAMRVHANFAEYVPLSLLLIFFTEQTGARSWLVHGLGMLLLAGRVIHAFGVSQVLENFFFRVCGMSMTFTTLLTASIYLLYSYAN